jgi:hypothetical protein
VAEQVAHFYCSSGSQHGDESAVVLDGDVDVGSTWTGGY